MDLGTSFDGPTNKTLMVLLISAAVLGRAFVVDTTFCSCAQVFPWNTCGFLGSSEKYSLVTYAVAVTTCTSESGSRTRRNPTGDDRVSSVHERWSGVKVVSSTTVLAHRFPPPLLSGC